MKQFYLIISGDVQGVGYRSWMKREAQKLQLAGWVKNRDDGAVEAIVQGEEKRVQNMVKRVRKGPDVAWVEHVDIAERDVDTGMIGFEVIC